MSAYKKTQMEIFETKNYSIFKSNSREGNPIALNREVTNIGVQRAKKNLKATRNKCVLPIAVNSNMVVLDGQHRLDACRELGIPVRFFKTSEIRQKDVSVIQGGKNWGLLDYVRSHANTGSAHFAKLLGLYENQGGVKLKMSSFGVLFQGRAFTTSQLKDFGFTLTPAMLTRYRNASDKFNKVITEAACNEKSDLKSVIKTETMAKAFVNLICNNPTLDFDHLLRRVQNTSSNFLSSRQQEPVNAVVLEFYNQGLAEDKKIKFL